MATQERDSIRISQHDKPRQALIPFLGRTIAAGMLVWGTACGPAPTPPQVQS